MATAGSMLKVLSGEAVFPPPVWMMRQAGRYLPEYRALRKQASGFLELCYTPDLAVEVTLQPIRRFGFDAAILFSDILTIPDAMGLGLYFAQGEGPMFERPLRDETSIQALKVPDPDVDLRYVMDAVSEIRRALNNRVPLIGFSGSPFTLACYMVEGRGGTDFREIKTLLYQQPELLHQILEKNTQAVTAYLNAQIESGAQAVMIFDTWGGALSHSAYQEFSLQYIQQIIDGLTREKDGVRIPNIVFTKGGGLWLEMIADTGCDAVGLDWTIDIGDARRRIGDKVALQGNLDPSILFSSPEVITGEVEKILSSFGHGDGHVFNLGHGISQFTPPEHAAVLVESVHALSRRFHAQ